MKYWVRLYSGISIGGGGGGERSPMELFETVRTPLGGGGSLRQNGSPLSCFKTESFRALTVNLLWWNVSVHPFPIHKRINYERFHFWILHVLKRHRDITTKFTTNLESILITICMPINYNLYYHKFIRLTKYPYIKSQSTWHQKSNDYKFILYCLLHLLVVSPVKYVTATQIKLNWHGRPTLNWLIMSTVLCI